MKKFFIFSASLCLIFALGTMNQDAMAQGKGKAKKSHGVSKSKGGPPSWAPAHGYRAKTRHVFFKDYNVYYDLEKNVYISLMGSTWSVTAELPKTLVGINLGGAVQVEIELDADDPQRYYKKHKG